MEEHMHDVPIDGRTMADLVRMDGRAAIVTGGGSGIGRAVARRLAEAGARVAIVDIDGEAAEKVAADLPGAIAVAADVRQEAEVSKYVGRAIDSFGGIDLFFNNAGLLGRPAPLIESTVADFDLIFGVNTRGAYFGLRDVGKIMTEQGRGGAIVCTASVAGLRSSPGVGLYSASKWAVIGLTRTAAKELAPAGIRVNAICPGTTITNFGTPPGSADEAETARWAGYLAKVPLGRFGSGDDQALAAAWLLSDAAAFVSGEVLVVDGGQEA